MNDTPVLTGSGLDIDLLVRVAQGRWRRFAGGGGARARGGARAVGRTRRGGRRGPSTASIPDSAAISSIVSRRRKSPRSRRSSSSVARSVSASRCRARRACGDAGARQLRWRWAEQGVACGARPPHRAPQPRRDTGRAAVGLDRRRRPRSARAHRAGRDRAWMGRVRWPRAPGRRGAAGGGTRASDVGPEGRARLVQRQRACPRGWPGSRCTPHGACCARPTARRCCRSKAMPPTRRSSIHVSPPRAPGASARSPPRERFRALLAGSSLYDAGAARSIRMH